MSLIQDALKRRAAEEQGAPPPLPSVSPAPLLSMPPPLPDRDAPVEQERQGGKWIVLAVLLLALGGVGGWQGWKWYQGRPPAPAPADQKSASVVAAKPPSVVLSVPASAPAVESVPPSSSPSAAPAKPDDVVAAAPAKAAAPPTAGAPAGDAHARPANLSGMPSQISDRMEALMATFAEKTEALDKILRDKSQEAANAAAKATPAVPAEAKPVEVEASPVPEGGVVRRWAEAPRPAGTWPRLSISGVIAHPESTRATVVINKNLMSIGETVDGVRIVDIQSGGVVLDNGKDRRLVAGGQTIP